MKRTAKWQRHITIAELRHLREQGAPSLVRFKKLRVAQKGMKAQWRERAVDLPTSKKPKMGRHPFDDKSQKRRNVTLSAELADKARKLGDGNVNAGIRYALTETKLEK